jgi:molybdenum cofactor cytidylyltransferase
VLDARLAAMGSRIGREIRCAHDEEAVGEAVRQLLGEGFDPVFVFGASAIVDRRDVVPAGIVRAGGEIVHFGMPVDPGNLMLIGRAGAVPVLGMPGCARSPRHNGFDFVLARILAGLEVAREDVMRLGAGGLLKAARVAALILAAGRSSRMGEMNKLLAEIDGKPMVARIADAALASEAQPVIVVTGHEAEKIREALAGRGLRFVHNPDHAEGLSTSLRAGIGALPESADAAVVCLGDMPDITPSQIDKLIAAFDPGEGRTICVPIFAGKRGNPVRWGAEYFPQMCELMGDAGAKHLIGEHADAVCEVAMPDDASLRDIDTPEELERRRQS